jgi:hypothetical protein
VKSEPLAVWKVFVHNTGLSGFETPSGEGRTPEEAKEDLQAKFVKYLSHNEAERISLVEADRALVDSVKF